MPDNVGNTLGTALNISVIGTSNLFTDSIEPGDEDFYRFTLLKQSSFSALLSGTLANADIQLLDTSGNVLIVGGISQESVNDGTLPESINTILDPGDYFIRVFPGAPFGTLPSTSYTLNLSADNGDRADIVWRNYVDGSNVVWNLDGATFTGISDIPDLPDVNWAIEALGDLNGDNQADLIWRNTATGDVVSWLIDGSGTVLGIPPIGVIPDLNWRIQGAGDFNSDGQTDLVWRNYATGDNVVWLLAGTTIVNVLPLNPLPDPNWQIQAVGDFTGDNKSDLVWRNVASGQNVIWVMDGIALAGIVPITPVGNLAFNFRGAGDFNGDGQTDLLYRVGVDNGFYFFNGLAQIGEAPLPQVGDLNWRPIAPFTQTPPVTSPDIAGDTTGAAFQIGPLNGDGVYRNLVNPTDPDDFYQFTLGSKTDLKLTLDGLTDNLDIELFDTGGLVSEIRTTAGSAAETINRTLDVGTYFIRIFNPAGSAGSAYRLALDINNLPQLTANKTLTVNEAATLPIGRDLLLVSDENNPPDQLTYTYAPGGTGALANGQLLLNGAVLASNALFKQADIDAGLLSYRHNGTETPLIDRFVFSVSDGEGGQIPNTTFSITVAPVNDPPVLSLNAVDSVTEGSALTLANTSLLVTDPEQGSLQLIYSLASLPTKGSLVLNTGGVGGLTLTAAGATFTQADINTGKLIYQHDGSESTNDSFTFGVSDGAGGSISPNVATHSITVLPFNDPPVLVSNSTITVLQNGVISITDAFLQATDVELTPLSLDDQIKYTITTAPANGEVRVNGVLQSTFSQADVKGGFVVYTHDGSNTNSDTFTFTLSDGVNNVPNLVFNLSVTRDNFVPVVSLNTGLTLNEAATQDITSAELGVSDRDNAPAQLIYTLTQAPDKGTLKRFGTPISNGQTFTQADLNLSPSNLSYTQDGSESTTDSFIFTIRDVLGAGVTNQTFSITVIPQTDAPVLTLNSSLTVTEGFAGIINQTLLSASDVDSLLSSITYNVVGSGPSSGSLVQGTNIGITSFTQAELNAGAIKYQNNGSESVSDSFVFNITDGSNTTTDQTFNINVITQNDAPGIALNGPVTLIEGATETLDNGDLSATDNDSLGALTYVITTAPTGGQLKLGDTVLAANGTFTQQDINNNLLTYTHGGSETPLSDKFSYRVSDVDGGVSSINTFTLNITPENDSPVLTVPAAQTLNEDGQLALTGTTVSDAENDNPLTLTLTVTNGTLAVGAGAPSNTVTITGTRAAVNTALGSVVYRPTTDYNGPDAIEITADDGISTPSSQTIALTVNPVNDAPTLTVPTGIQNVNEDTVLPLTITTTDVDSGENLVKATLVAGNGTLALSSLAGISFLDGTTDGSSTLTFTGTIANVATALSTLNYQGKLNFNGNDTITININDQGGTGGAPLNVSKSIAVNVAPINDAPSFTGGADVLVNEDPNPAGNNKVTIPGWATNISRGAANEASQNLTFIVTAANPALFSTQPTITSTGDLSFNLAKDANTGATGGIQITVVLQDSGSNTPPNSSQSAPYTFNIKVNPVNDAPTFQTVTANGNVTVDEDAPLFSQAWAQSISRGPLTAVDEAAQILQFDILSNSNPDLFEVLPTITPTGLLEFKSFADASGNAIITTRLKDDGGTVDGGVDISPTRTFTITVRPINDAPVLTTVTGLNVNEDDTLTVTGVTITDVDAGNGNIQVNLTAQGITGIASSAGTLSFASVAGVTVTGNNSSTVQLTGTLANINSALAAFTYKPKTNISDPVNPERITIKVDDKGNTGNGGFKTDTETLTILVNPVNDAPVLTVPTTVLKPTEDLQFNLTGVTVTDPDIGTADLTFTIASANGGTLNFGTTTGLTSFSGPGSTITATGSLTTFRNTVLPTLRYLSALNFDGEDQITITVSDGTDSDTKNISLDILPVNDAPQLTLPTGPVQVNEDTPLLFTAGDLAFVGTNAINLTDVDSANTPIRISLRVNNGKFTLGNTTGLTLINGANNSTTATYDGTLADLTAALNTLVYQGNLNYAGTTPTSTNDDTLTITLNDKGATGGAALSVTKSLVIDVLPVNDPAVLISNNLLIVNEGGTQTLLGGSIKATDPDDPATSIIYTVKDLPDNGTLLKGATPLAVNDTFTQQDITNGLIKYTHSGTETTNDSFIFDLAGVESSFNIQVNPRNDAPQLLTVNPQLTLTGGVTSTSVISLSSTDVDSPVSSLTYQILATPSVGVLRLGSTPLSVGSSFTQDQVNSGQVVYFYNGTPAGSDTFQLLVSDGNPGGTSAPFDFNVLFT